jgi:hypothetical protein
MKRIKNNYMRQPWKLPFTYEFKCEFCQNLFYSNNSKDAKGACNHSVCQNAFIKEKSFKTQITTAKVYSKYGNTIVHLHNGTSTLCNIEGQTNQKMIIGDPITDIENYPQAICQRCIGNWNFYYKP